MTVRTPKLSPEVFAACLLLTVGLHVWDILLPKIPVFPWLRLGLSYLVILPFLLRYGAVAASGLLLFRNLAALFYGGQVLSSFVISTLSGTLTLLAVGLAARWLYGKGVLGLAGMGILLAGSFNVLQLALVNWFYIQHVNFFFQLGPIVLWSVFTGILIAWGVTQTQSVWMEIIQPFKVERQAVDPGFKNHPAGVGLGILAFVLILLCPWTAFQGFFMVAGLFLLKGELPKILLRGWPFLFFIAWLHLFKTEGSYLWGSWITREGLRDFCFYALRLGNILWTGAWIARHLNPAWLPFRSSTYVRGCLLALPVLPRIFHISFQAGRKIFPGKNKQRLTWRQGVAHLWEICRRELGAGPSSV